MQATDYNRHQSFDALSDDAFLMKAYLSLLGRTPDASGAAVYATRLRAGVARAQIWSEIAEGEEARGYATRQGFPVRAVAPHQFRAHTVSDLLSLDGADFVRAAYRAILGRDADPTGLRDYVSRLGAGTPKQQLLADLRCDPEGQAFAAALPGLDDLVLKVQGGADATPTSLDDLLGLHGAQFVRAAYMILFKREADPNGLARYVELLRSGCSNLYVLKALYDAPEAKEKSATLPGLSGALKSYDKAQLRTWKGWYHREVMGSPSELPRERQSRAFAYRLLDRK